MWWAVPFVPARDELFQTNQKTVFFKSHFKHVFYSQKLRKKHNRREIRDTAPGGRQIKNFN
jgi:hypothetical protein